MSSYQSASYQQDVMSELARQAQVFFYGPGFEDYDTNDSIDHVIKKAPFDPDVIILGHTWLNDKDGDDVDPHPLLFLVKTAIPKAVILNKEYTNLNAKLKYIRRNRFDFGFTHHHNLSHYSDVTETEFVFWPFAYDPEKFKLSNDNKSIDLAFSGVLQNLNRNAEQSDIRIRIMGRLFHTWMDVPLFKKKTYADTNIFWNSISRKKAGRYLSAFLNKRKYLTDVQYAGLVMDSKVYINTLSPMGLVSPRFFECMASGALVFCEESELYKKIFPDDTYVTFKKDLSNFDEKFFYYLEAEDERVAITEKAYAEVQGDHTWQKRVNNLLQVVKNYPKGS